MSNFLPFPTSHSIFRKDPYVRNVDTDTKLFVMLGSLTHMIPFVLGLSSMSLLDYSRKSSKKCDQSFFLVSSFCTYTYHVNPSLKHMNIKQTNRYDSSVHVLSLHVCRSENVFRESTRNYFRVGPLLLHGFGIGRVRLDGFELLHGHAFDRISHLSRVFQIHTFFFLLPTTLLVDIIHIHGFRLA